ncbi:Gliding motility-associated lipoprotein GldK [uncultured Defluviicoccus sp.]|uniref:Gliding motility-associated lipoprotein GldK n=1 Tax=metagenome TaxID=256318 RepID=A0A380T9F2_9ZZZZ|nr:Gliding motility-associated lipoprotein GldK [uncultured Defluviicoccus sp.]
MVRIGGGDFAMGARPLHSEEGPPRRTRVEAFWIDETEVTNRDFARFVAATGYVTLAERPLDPKAYPGVAAELLKPSGLVFVGAKHSEAGPTAWWAVIPGADWRHPQGPESSIEGRDMWPVVQIAWADAMAYAKWLGRDLPTEAEWEYAARGGLEDATYVWGDKPPDEKPQANVWQGVFPVVDTGTDGYKAETAPVGCFPANGYKLHDMAGNVWEWTLDWYAPGLDPEDAAAHGPTEQQSLDPSEPGVAKHVIKGGSFLCADNYCLRYRPPARQAGPSDTGSSHIGFRTVLRGVASGAQ